MMRYILKQTRTVKTHCSCPQTHTHTHTHFVHFTDLCVCSENTGNFSDSFPAAPLFFGHVCIHILYIIVKWDPNNKGFPIMGCTLCSEMGYQKAIVPLILWPCLWNGFIWTRIACTVWFSLRDLTTECTATVATGPVACLHTCPWLRFQNFHGYVVFICTVCRSYQDSSSGNGIWRALCHKGRCYFPSDAGKDGALQGACIV